MQRYPGTELFRSKRRYMAAQRALYPVIASRSSVRVSRALRMVGGY